MEAGGSVSKLRKLVNDGKVSSAAFFRAFLAGMGDLKAQAATTTSTVGENFTRLANSMTVLIGSLDKVVGASVGAGSGLGALSQAIDGLAADEDKLRTMVELAERLAGAWAGAKIGRLAGGWGALAGGTIGAFAPELLELAKAEDALVSLNREADQLRSAIESMKASPMSDDPLINAEQLRASEAALAAVNGKIAETVRLRAMLGFRSAGSTTTTTANPAASVSITDHPTTTGAGKGATKDPEVKRIRRVTEELHFEAEQISRTAAEQEVFQNLQRAGVDLSSSEGQAIAGATAALQAKRTALERSSAAMTAVSDAGKDFLRGFVDDVREGEKATVALGNAVNRLADRLLDMAVNGLVERAIGGLFGTIGRGPVSAVGATLFHRGGVVGAGGQRRSVPAIAFAGAPRFHAGLTSQEFTSVLKRGEHVLTEEMAGRTASTMAGLSHMAEEGGSSGGGGGPLEIFINVSGARGNAEVEEMVRQGVQQGMREMDRALPGRIKKFNTSPRRRD